MLWESPAPYCLPLSIALTPSLSLYLKAASGGQWGNCLMHYESDV